MGLTAALNTALTGLNAANRTAQVVSSNIANALTPGYARRQLDVSASVLNGYGAGVGVNGTTRMSSPALLAERRLTDAALGQESTRTEVLQTIAEIFGTTETGDLSDRFARFEDALVEAAARPDSDTRLQTVIDTANALAGALNQAGTDVQDARADADAAIATEVGQLNNALERIRDLNTRIASAKEGSDMRATLEDMRQTEIDSISSIVPIRLYSRENGKVAVATTGGQLLLDGQAVAIGFTQATAVDANATAGGILSGLTINGNAVSGPPGGAFAGGSLDAHFQARDTDLVAAQEQLDAIARHLIERMSGSDADPTLTGGDPGLFTDAGAAFATANETGLAQRIEINTLADPGEGGDLWRLRDGLAAASAGSVGNATGLNRLIDVLADSRNPASGDFGVAAYTMSGVFTAASAQVYAAAETAEVDLAYATAQSETLVQEELSLGVDTDAETATLLLVEQAYAANARVIQTIDEMINRILEI